MKFSDVPSKIWWLIKELFFFAIWGFVCFAVGAIWIQEHHRNLLSNLVSLNEVMASRVLDYARNNGEDLNKVADSIIDESYQALIDCPYHYRKQIENFLLVSYVAKGNCKECKEDAK